MKKVFYILLAMMCAITLTACGNKNEKIVEETTKLSMYEENENADTFKDVLEVYEEAGEKNMNKTTAVMKVKNYGEIEIELLPEYAPITVANFQKLVNEKFYDNLTFHRIMQGFMIQGGDPEGTGMGGSNTRIKGEFTENGVNNTLSHKRGTISMARSSMPDSASSQFFICDADDEFLDGNYAAFGRVTKGMDVVDKIAADVSPRAVDGNGTILKKDQPIIESIRLK